MDKQQQKHAGLTEEDKQIVKQVKNKKREERRQRNKPQEEQTGKKRKDQMGGTDQFDQLLEKYQKKILKKMQAMPKGESGATFEEVDVSD